MNRTLHIFHNVSDRPMRWLDGYEPGDLLVRVFTLPIPDHLGDDVMRWCEYAYMVLNIGHEPFAQITDEGREQAIKYRERKNRSLSVGDVVMLDGMGWKCDKIGWTPVQIDHTQVTDVCSWGTTPINDPVPDWENA